MNGVEPGRSVDDLPPQVLEVIFACACTRRPPAASGGSAAAAAAGAGAYRPSPAIPLVCRRWRAIYESSTLLWEEVRVDWVAVARSGKGNGGGGARLAAQYVGRWLAARLPFCRRLVFVGFPDCSTQQFEAFPTGISSPRLLELHVLEATRHAAEGAIALLHACPALRHVGLAPRTRARGSEAALVLRGDALARLSALPALRSLDLHVDKLAGSTANLTPALSALTHLALRCRLESAALAPGLLEGLCQLRRLELASVRLAQFTPRLAQALSHLTHLSACDILAARPRRRAGITLWEGLRHLASLQELSIEEQGGGDLPANALACRGLTALRLEACATTDWPAAGLHRYTGEGGCLGRLQLLCLSRLRLAHPIPGALFRQLAPSLTALTWRDVRLPDTFEAVMQHAAAAEAGEDAMLEDMPELFQAVPLPPELSLLQRLRHLRIEHARLESVPACVQALPQLSLLSLEGNRLSSLAQGSYLTALQHLSLANNGLVEVPEGLAACSSLRELSLAGNPALALDEASAERLAAALPHLERLELSLPREMDSRERLRAWGQGAVRLSQLLGPRLELLGWAPAGGGGGETDGERC